MVTISDVAREAGVSTSTVSYVMSGKRAISADTRDRVQAAIARLGYRPHAGARSLASRSTRVIGLQAPLRTGVDVPVIMQVVAGVVQRARVHGYDILLLSSDEAEGLARASRGSMVDALLIMDVESEDARLATIAELDQPSVLIGLPAGRRSIPCIDFDFEAAGWLAVDRLVGLGHTRLALFGAPEAVMERHTSYADRLIRGFLEACEARGVEGSTHPIPDSAEALAEVDAVLTADPGITGILVHNDGALPFIADRIRAHVPSATAPDCLALTSREGALRAHGLTDTIAVPAEALGESAAEMICAMLAGGAHPSVQLLPPELAVGEPSRARIDS
ncbi:LacI family DNA-binding transcriptional regulator [Demequina sp. SYSU T00039]|uniref:LacI family DNA-binding transcriptional regulator n=1 Tax=Demequina lignilytica TaxID=3051663 RepID=A0AAW7M7U6_9MICO|nr:MULTISPECIES: LacI family DNA-binding transcriptional regulator [unclassified Demequina]MDN4477057.1 LacI family DNA-binding transcriptional regulator [Demequina sp. SYSU T00039-1]MDN4487230.1 LacI family DNA-binding transcriptional regulator [Demequina sp. SYSU T00039]